MTEFVQYPFKCNITLQNTATITIKYFMYVSQHMKICGFKFFKVYISATLKQLCSSSNCILEPAKRLRGEDMGNVCFSPE